jgi:hydroxyethylthiazole kinase-like uncharacterized protein yjeF
MTPALTAALIKKSLKKRPADSHKGQNGHVFILAGSRGMSGAAVLAARGALRIGAGLVTVGIVASERPVVTRQLAEALTLALPENADGQLTENALPLLQAYAAKRRVTTFAIGPGLGVDLGVGRLIKSLLEKLKLATVLDADGLNNLTLQDLQSRPDLVITPHPGELAHLLKIDLHKVQESRVRITENLARELGLVCVLKGHHSVISNGKMTRLNPTGNPAMATGGMGDVLTGSIAGLLAQKLSVWEATCAGVFLHGLAGDLARVSDRGLLATDVADALPKALAKVGIK